MDEITEVRSIATVIADAMKMKNISIDKLSQLTGVSDRFIQLLLEGKYHKLPSAPYVHGYFGRIANALNLNSEELWNEYTAHTVLSRTGKHTATPAPISFTKLSTGLMIVVGIALMGLIVIALRTPSLFGEPTISLESFDSTTSTSTFIMKGVIDPSNELLINDEPVLTDATGTFEKQFELMPGFNNFRINVRGLLGKEFSVTKQILLTTSTEHQVEPQ